MWMISDHSTWSLVNPIKRGSVKNYTRRKDPRQNLANDLCKWSWIVQIVFGKCAFAIASFASVSCNFLENLHHEVWVILQLHPEQFEIITFVSPNSVVTKLWFGWIVICCNSDLRSPLCFISLLLCPMNLPIGNCEKFQISFDNILTWQQQPSDQLAGAPLRWLGIQPV